MSSPASAPSTRPRVAIIGAGAMGQKYVEVLRNLSVDIAAVAARSLPRAQALADQVNARAFAGYRDLLEQVRPDIVYICTPTETHLDVVQAAVAHGVRAIYSEKPLAENMDQAREIVRLVEENQVLFGIGFKMRYEPVFSRAKEWIAQGAIGEVQSIQFNYFQTVPDWAHWYIDSGAIKELLAHPIDLANWLMGREPKEVHCRHWATLGGKGEDRAVISVNYGEHYNAQIAGGWIRDYPQLPGKKHNICFQIVGRGGYILGRRPDHLVVVGQKSEEFSVEPSDPFVAELTEFLECYEQGKPAKVGLTEAIHAQQVIDAALESGRSGSWSACRPL